MALKHLGIVLCLPVLLFTCAGCGSRAYDEQLERRIHELKSQPPAEDDSSDDTSGDAADAAWFEHGKLREPLFFG